MPNLTVAIELVGKDLASSPISAVTKNLDGLGDAGKRVQGPGGLGGLVDTVGRLGLGVFGAGQILGAVTGTIGGLLTPASNLAESMNKVGVVFGDSASVIKAFASTAAQALGQSEGAALEAAGTFGNLFVSMGLGQPAAADLSAKIVTLGSDLASFNNIPVDVALEKRRAGFVGEMEPLRALGVNLNAAAVEAEGMRLGLETVGGELTEAAKVQARYSLIVQQTQTAQGDFAETSTGMANAVRIIQASVADAAADFGGKFLPAIAPLVSAFATALPRALDLAGDAFDTVVGLVRQNVLPILAGLAATFYTVVVPAFAAWATAALPAALATVTALAPVVLAVGAVALAVKGLQIAWEENLFDIQGKTAAVWAFLEPIFVAIGAELARFGAVLLPELVLAWQNLAALVQAARSGLMAFLQPAVEGFAAFWTAHQDTIVRVLTLAWDTMVGAVQIAWELLSGVILAGLQLLQGNWQGAWDTLTAALGAAIDLFLGLAGRGMALLAEAVNAGLEAASGLALKAWNGMWALLEGAMTAGIATLSRALSTAGGALVGLLQGSFERAIGAFRAMVERRIAEIAALLPHSLAERGPLSRPTRWGDVLEGDLPEVGERVLGRFEDVAGSLTGTLAPALARAPAGAAAAGAPPTT